jgi:hypothetical protein
LELFNAAPTPSEAITLIVLFTTLIWLLLLVGTSDPPETVMGYVPTDEVEVAPIVQEAAPLKSADPSPTLVAPCNTSITQGGTGSPTCIVNRGAVTVYVVASVL